MNVKHRTVIVPRLPPSIDGLGDYGLNLARQLRSDYGLVTSFVVGDPSWEGPTEIEGFKVSKVSSRCARSLLEIIEQQNYGYSEEQTILLHYVGYGYARRGSPIWLVKALSQWKNAVPQRKLVIMFHELYAARGPIWNSQFWTSWLQKSVAIRLMNLCDKCLTSNKKYAESIILLSQGKHQSPQSLPVFSNVGEPKTTPQLAERPKRLIVFGGKAARSRVYKRSAQALKYTCEKLGITEIYDIGPKVDIEVENLDGLKIIALGPKGPEEVSNLLSQARAGFFDYPLEFLPKSGIFAAYCAHGLLPVGAWYDGQADNGVDRNKEYLIAESGSSNWAQAQMIADNAQKWYLDHSLSLQARAFFDLL